MPALFVIVSPLPRHTLLPKLRHTRLLQLCHARLRSGILPAQRAVVRDPRVRKDDDLAHLVMPDSDRVSCRCKLQW